LANIGNGDEIETETEIENQDKSQGLLA